jgi:hypothetical protein
MKFNLLQKVVVSTGLIAFVVLLTGCPFSSSVPIDEGSVKVSPALAGEWVSVADTGAENPTYYIITKDDTYKATAKKMEFSSSDSVYSATVYHLTFSDVKGDTFMNAMEDGGNMYSLFKFSFNEKADEIVTSEVSDYIKETFNSTDELKDFIAKNKSNSYFYTNTTETYIRKKLI